MRKTAASFLTMCVATQVTLVTNSHADSSYSTADLDFNIAIITQNSSPNWSGKTRTRAITGGRVINSDPAYFFNGTLQSNICSENDTDSASGIAPATFGIISNSIACGALGSSASSSSSLIDLGVGTSFSVFSSDKLERRWNLKVPFEVTTIQSCGETIENAMVYVGPISDYREYYACATMSRAESSWDLPSEAEAFGDILFRVPTPTLQNPYAFGAYRSRSEDPMRNVSIAFVRPGLICEVRIRLDYYDASSSATGSQSYSGRIVIPANEDPTNNLDESQLGFFNLFEPRYDVCIESEQCGVTNCAGSADIDLTWSAGLAFDDSEISISPPAGTRRVVAVAELYVNSLPPRAGVSSVTPELPFDITPDFFDLNGDDVLDCADLRLVPKQLPASVVSIGGNDPLVIASRLDTDGDGTITQAEVEAMRALLPCDCVADIAADNGNLLPPFGTGGTNNGYTEADLNAFLGGFFDGELYCDIADDEGNPLPSSGVNNGVTEADYNAFFSNFFNGCN